MSTKEYIHSDKLLVIDSTTFPDGSVICITGDDWVDYHHVNTVGEIISVLYNSVVLFSVNKNFIWIPIEKLQFIRFATTSEKMLWVLDTEDENKWRKE